MANGPFEYPENLGPHGQRLWDLYCEHFTQLAALDTVMLEQACRLVDMTPQLSADVVAGKKNAAITLGVITDKVIAMSGVLGLTYADRVKRKLEVSAKEKEEKEKGEEVKKKRGRPRTRLEDMRPGGFGQIAPDGPAAAKETA